ncbi:hypothetical protein, partial [Enterococcus faecium]
QELVDAVDHECAIFIKHYFHADWPTRSLYHMMLNTSMGDERVVCTLLDVMRRVQESPVHTGFEPHTR